ncbi:hypothetical protein ABH945_007314 [Paraburkholderia sp. GAS333]|uniref:hypothetical protein n=1 Tax=Paraburkholderia sp. GAS333 TaxID=3156279 RepID=UPI003D1B48E8
MSSRAQIGESRIGCILQAMGVKTAASAPGDGVVGAKCDRVGDVEKGKIDRRGDVIKYVYEKEANFAVYRTDAGPQMHLSENDSERAKQNKAVVSVDQHRVEIATLLRQWRGYGVGNAEARVAGALVAALRDDVKGALATLDDVKRQVVAERQLRGRTWSLGFSFVIAAFIVIILLSVVWHLGNAELRPWCRVATAGTLGALFSSTIALREKKSPANLNRLENFVDGASRIFVGATGAAVLFLSFKSGLVSDIKIGGLTLNGSMSDDNVMVIGFLAGFLERLVPDFLGRKS